MKKNYTRSRSFRLTMEKFITMVNNAKISYFQLKTPFYSITPYPFEDPFNFIAPPPPYFIVINFDLCLIHFSVASSRDFPPYSMDINSCSRSRADRFQWRHMRKIQDLCSCVYTYSFLNFTFSLIIG